MNSSSGVLERLGRPQAGAAALGGGLLVAASLPPWGWWPLAFPGLFVLDALLADQPRRARFVRGLLFGVGWLGPGLLWMVYLTAPGYPVAVVVYAAYLGAACAVIPASRWRWLALPAAMMIADAMRFQWPFGGVPLASLAIGQARGPLAGLARVGGVFLIGALTVAVAVLLRMLWVRAWPLAAALALGIGVLVVMADTVAPTGARVGSFTIALVQGGGPQGTHAVNDVPGDVYRRHLQASASVPAGVDLVLWPENVINLEAPTTFAQSDERKGVAALALRVGAPVAVGVTEDIIGRPGRFTNYQQIVNPDGSLGARYDKVHRVPFGEYLPLRSLIEHLPGASLVPHDAVSGRGPAVLDSYLGRLGVMISWEVFFGARARDAANHGALVLLNPTNGSSYHGTILQTQQVASSRLRAIETGRWVAQVAPTGFSAVIDSTGHVLVRSRVSQTRVIIAKIELRRGRTWYTVWGDRPIEAAALALIAAAWVAESKRSKSRGAA